MLHWTLRLSFLLAALGCATLFNLKRTDEPVVNCVTVNGGEGDFRLLVVGESWASEGKFFPELPQTISDRLQGRGVRACSIGFTGRSSRHLYLELREKFPKEKIYALFGAKKPDKVILMNGVNDEIQHVGAANYVEYTKKISEYFSEVDDVEIISIPRVNERRFKPPNLFSYVKRSILRCLYDNCDTQVNDVYRIALSRDHPELRMIEFDDFIDQYEGYEHLYTSDGVHLTDDSLHQYGAFLGTAASVRNVTAASR
jgi:hypothetical protein